MWKQINVNQQPRFMKYELLNDYHNVYYSDIVNVWMEKLTSTCLSTRCKEMNSLVEAEPEDLAKHIYGLIVEGEEQTNITCDEDSKEKRTLHIESQLAGIPFYFTFRMEKMNTDVVCERLTVPILLLALQQEAEIARLHEMLIAKDVEIDQYKLEGAVLKKRKVETKPFTETAKCQCPDQILLSYDAAKPDHLFAKICSRIPVVPNMNSPDRNLKMIKSEQK